jgi:hypothetical protein
MQVRAIIQEILKPSHSVDRSNINKFLAAEVTNEQALQMVIDDLFAKGNKLKPEIAEKLHIDEENQDETYRAEVERTKILLIQAYFNELELTYHRRFNLKLNTFQKIVSASEPREHIVPAIDEARVVAKAPGSAESQTFDRAYQELEYVIAGIADKKLQDYANIFKKKIKARKDDVHSKVSVEDLTLAVTLTTHLLCKQKPTKAEVIAYREQTLKLRQRGMDRVVCGTMLGLASATIAAVSVAVAVMSFGSLAPVGLLGLGLAAAMSIGATSAFTGTMSLGCMGASCLLFKKKPMASMRKIVDRKVALAA